MEPNANFGLRVGQADCEFLGKQRVPEDKAVDSFPQSFPKRHEISRVPESQQSTANAIAIFHFPAVIDPVIMTAGTADVVAYAQLRNKKVVHIDTSAHKIKNL